VTAAAAHISAVCPHRAFFAFGLALLVSSDRTATMAPERDATIKASHRLQQYLDFSSGEQLHHLRTSDF
jgi:hypothetical protein